MSIPHRIGLGTATVVKSLVRNQIYYMAGIAFMFLSWTKYKFHGYNTPTTFDASDWKRSIEHTSTILGQWMEVLKESPVSGDVLELGPGGHLSTGMLLLEKGARSYCAMDIFPLAANVPIDFYKMIFDELGLTISNPRRVEAILSAIQNKDNSLISYIVDANFDITNSLGDRRFDLIISCAAFEHFDDVERVIARLSKHARPGCRFVHLVDFQTQSRWIRTKDPNNIYRYSDIVYWALDFPSKPNRKRPNDYISYLISNGWTNPRILCANVVDAQYLSETRRALDPQFRTEESRMDILSAIIAAEFSKTMEVWTKPM